MNSPHTTTSIGNDEVLTENRKSKHEIKPLKVAYQSDKDDENSSVSVRLYCIIKNGLYSGHLAKVTSENKKCGRFNMRLVSELGHYCRRKDGTVMHTALARSSFDYLNAADMNISPTNTLDMILEATGSEEAIRIRKERLELGESLVYTPGNEYRVRSNVVSNAPNSRPIPRVASRSNRQGGGADGADNEELDESKSNLYWVNCRIEKTTEENDDSSPSIVESSASTSSFQGFPCLWYGSNEDDLLDNNDRIEVLPLALPSEFAPGYEELLATQSFVLSRFHRSNDMNGMMLASVYRFQLIPLDEDILLRELTDDAFVYVFGYLSALLAFVEWSEYFKDAFTWPSFIIDLFRNDDCITPWFKFAVQYNKLGEDVNIRKSFAHAKKNTMKIFLLYICGTHIGVITPLTLVHFIQGEATKEVRNLMKDISNLIEGGTKQVCKTSSRVGPEYQTIIPNGCGRQEITPISRVHYKCANDDALDCYLGVARSLQEQHIWIGQLVEVPINFTDFSSKFEKFLLTFEPEWIIDVQLLDEEDNVEEAQQQFAIYKRACALDEFIAASRRSGNRVTTLAIVKQIDNVNNSTNNNNTSSSSNSNTDIPTFSSTMVVENEEYVALRSHPRYCKFFNMNEDQCCVILSKCQDDTIDALDSIERKLKEDAVNNGWNSADVPIPNSFTLQELKHFGNAARIYPNNFNKIHTKYEKSVIQDYKDQMDYSASKNNNNSADADTEPMEYSEQEIKAITDEFLGITTEDEIVARQTRKELYNYFLIHFPQYNEGGSKAVVATAGVNAYSAEALQNYGRSQQPMLDLNKFHVDSSQYSNPTLSYSPPVVSSAPLGDVTNGQVNSAVKSNSKPNSTSRVVKVDGKRDRSIPNRWPSTLPLMTHNMYWLKTSNSPCMCVGLDPASLRTPGDGMVTIITVCCATYHHAVSVPASKLEPLDEEIIKTCADERAVGFALAMIDFAEYELQSLPFDSMLRRWYIYPAFIRRFLHNMQIFAAWRKQVERSNRDSKADRRKVYYNGLVETYNANIESERKDIRLFASTYPWDDTPIVVDDDFSESGSGVEETTAPEKSALVTPGKDQPLWPKSGQKRKLEPEESIVEEASAPVTISKFVSAHSDLALSSLVSATASNIESSSTSSENKSNADSNKTNSFDIGSSQLFNLFWVSKSKLPCVYYDSREREHPDKVTVLPICCSTYHYPVQVVLSYMEPLSIDLLRQCTDDRTHDFTLAMIEFAQWDITTNPGGAMNLDESFYEWPDFILELLLHPKVWAAWRKKVERASVGKPGTRIGFYFEQLKEDFLQLLSEESNKNGQVEVDNVEDEVSEKESNL